jgi:diguanylate cyclase (GGDEF)-like protein
MIGAQSLRELVAVLVTDIPLHFPGVDGVTLACVDLEYEMARLLEQGGSPVLDGAAFVPVTRAQLNALFAPAHKPRLGGGDEKIRALLFPAMPQPPASVALAPLVLRGELIGCLNQASHDPRHFSPGTATDLLEHLAAVTALCVDNAVSHERLKLDGLTDSLTSVANRRFFERRLSEEVERWARRSGPLVCMLVDIDFFKQVNDRYGHQVGDQVLQRVAALLGQDLRGSDVLARYGGEEFVLLLPATSASQGRAIAERLRTRVARENFSGPDARRISVTVSVGLACLPPEFAPPDAKPAQWLLSQADAALYQAKHSGRNCVVTQTARL